MLPPQPDPGMQRALGFVTQRGAACHRAKSAVEGQTVNVVAERFVFQSRGQFAAASRRHVRVFASGHIEESRLSATAP